MADFTPTQGRYLAFIHAYIGLHGYPPAESEIRCGHVCLAAIGESNIEDVGKRKDWALQRPGQPRSLQILVPEKTRSRRGIGAGVEEFRARGTATYRDALSRHAAAPPANLYVVSVFLTGGADSEEIANKEIRRDIEIRGDQTFEQLHQTIFAAFDRFDEHLYEFQFGKRPFDPKGPNYGIPDPQERKKGYERRAHDRGWGRPRS